MWQVWNKTDRRYYAIKKIKLDSNSKALNKKKILREVTLLSKLNHENIVRYFYSWTETTTIKEEVTDDSSSSVLTEPKPPIKLSRNLDLLTSKGCIEELAPPAAISVVTFDSQSQPLYDDSDDESSEDDDETSPKWVSQLTCDTSPANFPPHYRRFYADSGSESIIFEGGSEGPPSSKGQDVVDSVPLDGASDTPKESLRQMEYLYIQMEFCERSTLRTAIDADIYQKPDRVWRFFREIVEGEPWDYMGKRNLILGLFQGWPIFTCKILFIETWNQTIFSWTRLIMLKLGILGWPRPLALKVNRNKQPVGILLWMVQKTTTTFHLKVKKNKFFWKS